MTVLFYLTPKHRVRQIKSIKGESLEHDDFIDKFGNKTDGKSGRLTFAVLPVLPMPPKQTLDQLNQKFKDRTLPYPELLDLLEMQALMIGVSRWARFRALFR